MRRGRMFIYLALIIIIGVVAGWYYLKTRQSAASQQSNTQATPTAQEVQVVSAAQDIIAGSLITEAMLSSSPLPADLLTAEYFKDTAKPLVVGMYAESTIPQGAAITASQLSKTPGTVNMLGSAWASSISQGLTAVSIPITRLSSAAYGIRDGDYVDVIATVLLVEVDSAFQSALPNDAAQVKIVDDNQQMLLAAQITSGGEASQVGRAEQDAALNVPMYLVPSESQRPRLVTQMIMQNVRVLHVGTFPLPAEETAAQASAAAAGEATPTPQAGVQQTTSVERPDIVTLMVAPQDAVMLTYLIYSGAEINLTLRNPSDQEFGTQPDAATLEYLLTQYNIPVPAKLPYSLQPRLDDLQQPTLPNDTPSTP